MKLINRTMLKLSLIKRLLMTSLLCLASLLATPSFAQMTCTKLYWCLEQHQTTLQRGHTYALTSLFDIVPGIGPDPSTGQILAYIGVIIPSDQAPLSISGGQEIPNNQAFDVWGSRYDGGVFGVPFSSGYLTVDQLTQYTQVGFSFYVTPEIENYVNGEYVGNTNLSLPGSILFTISDDVPADQPPVANAGTDQTVHVRDLVTLDGSASSDPSGHPPLTYVWSFTSKPVDSNAILSDPSVVNPTFTPDVVGNYVIQLVVTDAIGLSSQPAKVTISTLNSSPVADAGLDQAITVIGTTVHLNGSQSYDPDGQPIIYQWFLLSKPAGSVATLTGENTATPSFIADVHGDYSIRLTVFDSFGAANTDVVRVSFNNVAPVANAGQSQSTIVGQTVTLNGSGSIDANGDPLSYGWSVTSAPSGSQATIANSMAQIASFVPDVPGTFVIQLIVNDGFVDSLPTTVQIEAMSSQTKVTQDIHSLQHDIIANIAPSAFKNATMQNAVLNKLNAVIANLEAGNYLDALGQLQNDILGKTNGCFNSGVPDKNDWILSCSDQNSVYPALLSIITEVEALLGQP